MTVAIELFPCSGGMAEGFRRAGIDVSVAFEIDSDACEAYARNLGRRPVQLDVRTLPQLTAALGVPPGCVDLVVADPPCTPWSRAGKRRGLEDERDMLVTTAELLGRWRPRCWLVGNVPGLDDASNAASLRRTLGTLSAHYCIDYASLDAAAYGVPQHRVRPFWFGHPRSTACIRWPVPTHGGVRGQLQIASARLEPYVTVRDALAHLTAKQLGKRIQIRAHRTRCGHPPSEPDRPALTIGCSMPNTGGVVLAYGRGDHRAGNPDAPARTITSNTHSDGALLTNIRHPINRADAPSYTVTTKGDGRGAQGACVMPWPWDRPSTTVTTRDEVPQHSRNGRAGTPQSANAIKLSERAAAILQGFPEGWHFVGKTKRSRWSQIGQAMPPPLAHTVAGSVAVWLSVWGRAEREIESA